MYFRFMESYRDHLNAKLMKFSCKIIYNLFSFKYNKSIQVNKMNVRDKNFKIILEKKFI